MKSIDFNKSDDLIKFKDYIVRSVNEKIESAKLKDSIASIDSLPLGTITSIFESVSDKLFNTDSGKRLIKEYVKALKGSDSLKWEFSICKMVSDKYGFKNPGMVLAEAAKFSESVNRDKFNKEKRAVSSIVKKAIKESKISNDELNEVINNNRVLNEGIEYIMTVKKTPSNLIEHVDKLKKISDIVSKKELKEEVNESFDGKDLVSKLIENVSGDMPEWQMKALSEMSFSALAGQSNQIIFEGYKDGCIRQLDRLINEDHSIEELSRFSKMREQLTEKAYSDETSINDILTLSELRYTLSNE